MDLQGMLFDYVDRFRSLLPPGAWQGLARNLAKNDVLALLAERSAERRPRTVRRIPID